MISRSYLFTITLVSFIFCISKAQSNYAKGFEAGYKRGYCLMQGGSCISPIPPIAPIPVPPEDHNSWQDGYDKGLITGKSAYDVRSLRSGYVTSKSEFIEPYDGSELLKSDFLRWGLTKAKSLAKVQFENGEYKQCIETISTYIKVTPNDFESLVLLGFSYAKLEQYENAIACLSRAYKLSKNPRLKKLILEIKKKKL